MNISLPDTLKSFVDELANRDIDDAIAYYLSEGDVAPSAAPLPNILVNNGAVLSGTAAHHS